MVEQQLRTRNIKSTRVLDAMRKVPRHLFMPEEVRRDAYLDRPVPIGEDQTISQPYIVALMTQTVEPQPHQRALEIGTGSGYQAAVLAELVGQVYTIEIISLLGERARGTLEELGYDNVEVRVGDGYKGWPEEAPFDIILVTAAAGEIPEPLLEQLAEGGKLVMPVGQVGGIQALTTVTKTGGEVFRTHVTDVRFVPMTGEIQRRWPGSSISPGLP
jgi:protein-L-isoaspartate(D-aspartate) O-methyltransferase